MGSLNQLKLVNWNSRSVLLKKVEFFDFLVRHQIDVATVSETWLKTGISFYHPNYCIFRADRTCSDDDDRGGGVLIALRKGIDYKVLDLSTSAIEAVGLEIRLASQSLHVIAAYFPGIHRGATWNAFRRDINTLVRRTVPFFVAGDFNARHRQWNCLKANRAGNILVSRAASSDFFIHAPRSFTYLPRGDRRPSTLDIVLSNNLVDMSALTVVNDLSSDHLPVRFDVNVSVPFNHTPPTTKCYNRANWQLFQRVVNEKIDLTSPDVANLDSPEAIDRCVEFFTSTLLEAETFAVPVVPVRTYEDAKFPEIARQLVTLRNTRRRQWYRTRDPLLGMIVESLNNRIRFECSIARNQHFSNNIRNLENGAKDVWKISKALRKKVKYSPPLKDGDTLKASPAEKANLLADNFARAHCNPSPGDPATSSAVDGSVQQTENSTFPVESVPIIRPKEIARIIKSLKPKKAPGEDKIRNTLLKRLPRKGLVMLTKIVNACLRTSHFPTSWKHAVVTAIPKPGKDITNPTNYRPISLLPVMSKILERVVLTRIEGHIEQRNVVPPQQFGFKRGHSTNHQLARLTRNVKNSLNRGESAGMILLDVEKAYDSVWQDAILHKMKLAEFPTYILKLLNSFLKQRSFQVAVDGVLSRRQQIPFGVPQGAVLSPALYNIFTSDLVMVNGVEYYLFADDTGFVAADKSAEAIIEKLQSAQNSLESYQQKWRIKINPAKTQAIFFTRRRSERFLPQRQIAALGHEVPWSDEVKYLGLVLDPKLKFDKHIGATLEKCDKLTRLLYPLVSRRSRLSNANKILLYKLIFRPTITYGFPAWHSCATTRRKKLQTRQNKLLKMMLDLPFNFPTDELEEAANTEILETWTSRLLHRFWTSCAISDNDLISNLVP